MERTTYSTRDTKLPGLSQSPISTTSRRTGIFQDRDDSRSRARRNLMTSYDQDIDQTVQTDVGAHQSFDTMATSTPLPDDYQLVTGNVLSTHKTNEGWSFFLFCWIIILLTGSVGFYIVYQYFPAYKLLCFTKEMLVSVLLGFLCIVLFSAIVKISRGMTPSTLSKQRQESLQLGITRVDHQNPGDCSQMAYNQNYGNSTLQAPSFTQSPSSTHQILVKRTFSADGKDSWTEYLRYFENVASLNNWEERRKLGIFFTMLRGQAETFANGLSDEERGNWLTLTSRMNERFGNKAMKESYIAEAKLRTKKSSETFRDFGQALEDLYRWAYPNNKEYVAKSSLKTF